MGELKEKINKRSLKTNWPVFRFAETQSIPYRRNMVMLTVLYIINKMFKISSNKKCLGSNGREEHYP